MVIREQGQGMGWQVSPKTHCLSEPLALGPGCRPSSQAQQCQVLFFSGCPFHWQRCSTLEMGLALVLGGCLPTLGMWVKVLG